MELHTIKLYDKPIQQIQQKKALITTLNAHSFNLAVFDSIFNKSLKESHFLIPDGISIVWAIKFLTGRNLKKITGNDLFEYEMQRLQKENGSCFFLGSNESTLTKIRKRVAKEYPNVRVKTYAPPYKATFTQEDSLAMLNAVNTYQPDVLFIGMTAPKQEKWAFLHFDHLKAGHVCCIGAVFDFYAGTINRAPKWMIQLGFEWFYRLIKEPRRMWRRYLIGNTKFIYYILKEKMSTLSWKPKISLRKLLF